MRFCRGASLLALKPGPEIRVLKVSYKQSEKKRASARTRERERLSESKKDYKKEGDLG